MHDVGNGCCWNWSEWMVLARLKEFGSRIVHCFAAVSRIIGILKTLIGLFGPQSSILVGIVHEAEETVVERPLS